MTTAERRCRMLVRPSVGSASRNYFSYGGEPVNRQQLMEEVQGLVRGSKCLRSSASERDCPFCARLGGRWALLVSDFGPCQDPHLLESSQGPPTAACCTLKFTKHYTVIGGSTVFLHIVAFGYTETDLWQTFLAPVIRRVKLSSIPPIMNSDCWSQLQILELCAWRRRSKKTVESQEIVPMLPPLFTPTELDTLLAMISSPSSRLQVLDLTRCSFEFASIYLFFCAISQSPTLVDVCLKECDLQTLSEPPNTDTSKIICNPSASSCLRDLTIQECVLDEDALQCLSRLLFKTSNRLQHLVLVKNDWPLHAGRVVAESLLDHTSLQILDLSGLGGGEDVIQSIGYFLESSSCLQQLNISEAPQVMDVAPLARALIINSGLIELDLFLNRMWNTSTLAEALCHNQTLRRLNLSKAVLENDEDDDDSGSDDSVSDKQVPEEVGNMRPSFFTNLGNTKALNFLNLSYLHLPRNSMKELAESLRFNTSLETLHLNDLDRSFETAELDLLVPFLQHNMTLQSLELGRNPLTEKDIKALVSSLVVNRSLKSLTLSGCDLTDVLLLPLARRLPDFYHLEDLDLSFNAIGKDGVNALMEGLQSNYCIRSIVLYNSMSSCGGPVNFSCRGYADEDRQIQALLRTHRQSNWAFRLEHSKNDPTKLFQILRDDILPELCKSAK